MPKTWSLWGGGLMSKNSQNHKKINEYMIINDDST